jgi:hypothetical protein
MKIEIKYSEGDLLFFLRKGKIIEQSVDSIRVEVEKSKIKIVYWFRVSDISSSGGWIFETKEENEVFESRESLINSL